MESDCCEVDRLSNLPDDLIHKILSYLDVLYSITLCVLSSRWRFIWTSMPNLNFSGDHPLWISSRYHEFVNDVLSARNNKIDVSSVSLHLPCLEDPELSRLLEYAFSHNVQQLSISRCKSLKHLTLLGTTIDCRSDSTPLNLPALTTLHLNNVNLYNCSSILAMCQNLKNLTLERCKVFKPEDADGFTISNSQLLCLTLKKVEWNVDFVNVDTPQLKNLIFVDTPQLEQEVSSHFSISEISGELTISARGLTYLRIKGSYFPKLSLDRFPSLEKVDLCISYPQKTNVHRIFDLFQRLHNVKSLALSLEIVELLSTSEEVISHQPSPFPSLKSLKIYPSKGLKKTSHSWLFTYKRLTSSLDIFQTQPDEEQEAMKIKLSAEVTNYLLGSSSNATFTMVSPEEVRSIKITTLVYRLMATSRKILEEIEAYCTDTKRANVEWKKTLADDDSCRDHFVIQIGPPGKTTEMLRILKNINLLLTKVLESKRVEMEACYSRLYAKTTTIVNKMMADMKNQCDIECDIQQRNYSGCLDEIALSS